MTKLIAEIKVSGLEIVETLFELLSDNLEHIQEPLKSKLLDWLESQDKGWVSWSDISPEFIDSNNCIVMMNGIEQMHVTGYNRILQKVKVIDYTSRAVINIVKADSFSIKNIGFDNFVSWGE
jgi:hypothetical protein